MSGALASRFDFLRSTQNSDGGWGFFPGKQSWLEPTAYALMALHSDSASQPSASQPVFERGWKLMRSWQMPDGSWRPCAAVPEPHWTTALAVTLHCLRGVTDESFERGVAWLTATSGIENGLEFRLAHWINPSAVELDPSFKAWPWLPGCASWIEPTAHSLVALKKAAVALSGNASIRDRIAMGEKMILERRCSDGGWNYGNRRVLGEDLRSYPETTALALLGLSGNPALDLKTPLALAARQRTGTRSPLARAWLDVALRSHASEAPPISQPPAPADIMVNALQIIAHNGVLA